MSGPLILHTKLLVHILAYFYISKQREKKLSQKAHIEAIYETGARLTHDMKNMLQSLSTLAAVIEKSDDNNSKEILGLVKRQLPALNERLYLTLEKMSSPQIESQTKIKVSEWWSRLKDRNVGRDIIFTNNANSGREIILELFDTVVDNLLDNARVKRLIKRNIQIEIILGENERGVYLRLIDSGWAIDSKLVSRLFSETIDSETGLGIGLYQSSKHASRLGYRLYLKNNMEGDVCFSLEIRE